MQNERRIRRNLRIIMVLLALGFAGFAVVFGITQHSLFAGFLAGGLLAVGVAGGATVSSNALEIPGHAASPVLQRLSKILLGVVVVLLICAGVIALLGARATAPLIAAFAAAVCAGVIGLTDLLS